MDYQTLFLTNDGRINRGPFWIGGIILAVASVVLGFVDALIFGNGVLGSLLEVIISLALLYPSINLGIKRFHDRDKSGWWLLILFVPILGAIWYFVEAGCLPGTIGPNRFGPDPLK
ncbi:MAG: DUF805 domain-containing protein [Beijerinckiaceae bacterium]|nr:MAG: DUF805 domain-containing protein [Beijerinckiaceae bacterium]